VSWPQCGKGLPGDGVVGIVGVNGGRPYEPNPCLATQFRWAATGPRQPAFYMNTANPGTATTAVNWYALKTPNPGCSRADEAACAFNYGFHAGRYAFEYAQSQTGAATRASWWLDVETGNSWSGNQGLNNASIAGSIAYLRSKGLPVGAYSTRYQWGRITGGLVLPDVPSWVAGARSGREAASFCTPARSFTGGPVVMVQWVEHNLDHDHLCAPLPAVTAQGPAAPSDLEKLVSSLVPDDLERLVRGLFGQPGP
jgi:hypothetical protein